LTYSSSSNAQKLTSVWMGHEMEHLNLALILIGNALGQFRTHKVIYRRYAGLFFSMCVDITDNELAYLESIHLFVEILDHFFSNVCELDLVFNYNTTFCIAFEI
jgi:hypothetical protein